MNTTTKGIIGAVGAAAIGVGAYFGFSGGEDNYQDSEVKRPTKLEVQFDELLKAYDKTGVMPDTDDDNIVFNSKNDFNIWSWQKYLHLTQNVGTDEEYKPLFLKDTYQVDGDGGPIDAERRVRYRANGFKYYGNTIKKDEPLTLKLYKQATTKVIHIGDVGTDTVYYSVHINDKMKQDFDTHSIISIEDEDFRVFSMGALELKVAWADVNTLSEVAKSKCIVQHAEIYNELGIKTGEKKMAMIGMHIVGITKGHPEFIWSTFENDELALHSSEVTGLGDEDYIVQDTAMLNQNNDKDYVRHTPYGVPSDGDLPYRQSLIDINHKVKSTKNLATNYFLNGSIWFKQIMEDNVPVLDNNKLGKIIIKKEPRDFQSETMSVGSMLCANVSMETDIQNKNCFLCHKTSRAGNQGDNKGGKSNLYFSHLYVNREATVVKIKEYLETEYGVKNLNLEKVNFADNPLAVKALGEIPEKIYAKIFSQVKKENAEYFESLK